MTLTQNSRPSQRERDAHRIAAGAGPSNRTDQTPSDTQPQRVGSVPNSRPSHTSGDTQRAHAGAGTNSEPATMSAAPMPASPVRSQTPAPATGVAMTRVLSLGRDSATEPTTDDSTPITEASARSNSPAPATFAAMPMVAALGQDPNPPDPAMRKSTPIAETPGRGPILYDDTLSMLAETLYDIEQTHIAAENRHRQFTRTEVDKDGVLRGHGYDDTHEDVQRHAAIVKGLEKIEEQTVKDLGDALKTHPLGPWMKSIHGIGPKQGARLLAAIGDPYWNTLHDRPRTVSELWAYSGYSVLPVSHTPADTHTGCADGTNNVHPGHDLLDTQPLNAGVAQKRQRGQKSNWNADAKMRAYLIAAQCMKLRSPTYRPIYDEARVKYADAVHRAPCAQCGKKGKPAPIGTPLRDGHINARALRIVAKNILKDLWTEAKRIHEEAATP